VLGTFTLLRLRFISGLTIGAALCILLVNHQFVDLPYLMKPNSSIKGTVISLPQAGKFSTRMSLKVSSIDERASNARILIYWAGRPEVSIGDVVTFSGKVKPIHSSLNQGGFNYQRWLVANGYAAQVSVKNGVILSKGDAWQHHLKRQITDKISGLSHRHYINALALGDRSMFTDDTWQLLRNTGTSHLFAISGLHLSMLALFTFTILRQSFLRIVDDKYIRHCNMACSILSFFACYAYADLSGFALPTLRALMLLGVLAFFLALKQRVGVNAKLLFCLVIVLIVSPTAVLSASFWLSFGAMALIYMLIVTKGAEDNKEENNRWWRYGKQFLLLQVWLFFGLFGLNVIFFGGISTIGPVANFVAVPVVSFLVLPLILLALLAQIIGLSGLVDLLFYIANGVLAMLFSLLEFLQQINYAWLSLNGSAVLPLILLIFGLLLVLWLRCNLLDKKIVVVTTSLSLLAIVACLYQPPLDDSRWSVHFLDVGQGNATVIVKGGVAIIIDTGKRYTKGSAASRIIVPFIEQAKVDRVDMIVVTHDDNDHSGGLLFLHQQYPAAKIISNQQEVDGLITQSCEHIAPMQWQGLDIMFTKVPASYVRTNNDSSCLIRVGDNNHSVLLVGDIGKKAEQYFTQTLTPSWRSTILQIGHHGSKTSSSKAFLTLIAPQIGIISASRFNQWGFPHPTVVQRLKTQGIVRYENAKSGQISFTFDQGELRVRHYRHNIAPFWYNRDLSFGHYD